MDTNIPVVIFCGGLGTRLREETEYRPKPMVQIGEWAARIATKIFDHL